MANILIVDDAKFMRITLANILNEDHKVIGEAENGNQAVVLYEQLKPDLVIMDITMPELTGTEALRKIKELDGNAKVIMCSAIGQQKLVLEAIELGAKDYIIKPFEESRVLEAVHQVVSLTQTGSAYSC